MADAISYRSNYFPSKIIHCKNSSKAPLCTYSTGCVWRHYLEQEPYVRLPARSVQYALSHFTLLTAQILLPELSAAISPKRARELNPFPSCLISWSLECSFTAWWEGFWQGPTFSTAAEFSMEYILFPLKLQDCILQVMIFYSKIVKKPSNTKQM